MLLSEVVSFLGDADCPWEWAPLTLNLFWAPNSAGKGAPRRGWAAGRGGVGPLQPSWSGAAQHGELPDHAVHPNLKDFLHPTSCLAGIWFLWREV